MTTSPETAPRTGLGVAAPFAVPIGLSAFLLFSVEPLIGRLVLPVFGGTPSVWATTLFFFQVVLLGGYLYAHLSVTQFGRWGPLVHLAVGAIGFIALVSAASSIAPLRDETSLPVLNLLGILVGLIGLPALVLTTTTPLLSGWFGAIRDGRQGDPYWLYALSNAGSLLALLAYPLLIEPRLGLATQRLAFAGGYAILIVLIARAAWRAMPDIQRRPRSYFRGYELIGQSAEERRAIDWDRRGRWMLLAAVPSGLLAAVTNFIATDLVSAPLLWVIPLAIYLASFIVAFSPRLGRLVRVCVLLVPAAATMMWVPYGTSAPLPILITLALELVGFAIIAIGLHGTLASDRPDPAHLTEFYLVISTGGALASALVAVVAPVIFPDIWEYPILLVGALAALAVMGRSARPAVAVRSGLHLRPFVAGWAGRLLPFVFAAAALMAVLVLTGSPYLEVAVWLVIGGLLLLFGGRDVVLVGGTAVLLLAASLAPTFTTQFRARSFFGVTEVIRQGDKVLLMNGTILHGLQFTEPDRRRTPATYYGPGGPAGDVFAVGADSSAVDPKRIGIVGLGAGTLAAYKDEWMTMTYFEIDPVVIEVAEDPRYFTYLSDAPGAPEIVEGDARLSLAKEADGSYDLLVLDAFSSDTIPIHLLTLEAITDEVRTMAPGGLIAFHISNRYYELSTPIAAALADLGLVTVHRTGLPSDNPGDETALPTSWLAASRNTDELQALRDRGWESVIPAPRPFTDDYADLLSYLRLLP